MAEPEGTTQISLWLLKSKIYYYYTVYYLRNVYVQLRAFAHRYRDLFKMRTCSHVLPQNSRMAERQNGRIAEWQNGRMVERQNGMALLGFRNFLLVNRMLRRTKVKEQGIEEDRDGGGEYESDIEPVDDTSTLRDKGNMVSNSMQLFEI